MNDYIAHYGIKRRSGRYPWGSGEHPKQRLDKKEVARERKSLENAVNWFSSNNDLESYNKDKILVDLKYYKKADPKGYEEFMTKYGSGNSKSKDENIANALIERGKQVMPYADIDLSKDDISPYKRVNAGKRLLKSYFKEGFADIVMYTEFAQVFRDVKEAKRIQERRS